MINKKGFLKSICREVIAPEPDVVLPYVGKWTAVTFDGKKVVASAKSLEVLLKKRQWADKEEVILSWIPPLDVQLVPATWQVQG
ncbi:MAG: hypothetical protein AAB599_02855 [Patescibacteria group bacterium]